MTAAVNVATTAAVLVTVWARANAQWLIQPMQQPLRLPPQLLWVAHHGTHYSRVAAFELGKISYGNGQ